MKLAPNRLRPLAIAAIAAALAGCATLPEPLRGSFAAVTPEQAGRGGAEGERVRWGGTIIGVDPRAEATCFEVLGRPLGDNARPRDTDVGTGRFLACRGGFYDPAIFDEGREMTVVGRVSGSEVRPVGEYAYPYPRVDADVVFLWPERDERDLYYVGAPWFHHPHFWGGYYLRPYHPIIVRRPPPE